MRRAAPPIVIAAFALALMYRVVLLPRSFYWGDIFLYFAPILQVERAALLHGRLPLWNSAVLCGEPLVGNPQCWLFYPSIVLLRMLPVTVYLGANAWLHVTLAGLGMYLFVRRISGDRIASTLGAATFCGSGFLFARMQFPSMVQCASLLPFLMLLTDRVLMRPGFRDVGMLGLVLALTLLAGHPQVAHMSLIAATSYAVACLWRLRGHRRRVYSGIRALAAALVIGFLTASVQLLPGAELYTQSSRADLTIFGANRFVLHPEQLITLIFPYWFGSPARGDFWAPGNIWEPCLYVGLVPLALAAFALRRGAHRHAIRFFVALCVITLWLAMGRVAGLYWIAYYLIPGQSAWHDPARFVFLYTFAVAVLAAIGMRLLRDRGVSPALRVSLLAIAMANLWWFSAAFNPTVSRRAYTYRPRALRISPPSGFGRTSSTLREAVWQRYVNYSDYGPESTRYANELTYTMSPNIGERFGVQEASGYEPVPTDHINRVDALTRAALETQSPHLGDLLGLMNAWTVFLPQSTRCPHPALQPDFARGVEAFRVRRTRPRYWLVRSATRIDGDARALAAISRPDFDPATEAIVSGDCGIGDWPAWVPQRAAAIAILHRAPGLLQVRADAGPAPAMLVASATWYPGWRATVDGRPARLNRADLALMGVALPPGRHVVELAYKPFVVRFGLYLTLIGVAGLASALTYGRCARRRAGNRPTIGESPADL